MLPRLALLLPLLLLPACATRSEVVELEGGLFALTMQAASPATAARTGVTQARAFCAVRDREFEVVRSEIGVTDYRIAFRCPGVVPAFLTPPDIGVDTPGFRPGATF